MKKHLLTHNVDYYFFFLVRPNSDFFISYIYCAGQKMKLGLTEQTWTASYFFVWAQLRSHLPWTLRENREILQENSSTFAADSSKVRGVKVWLHLSWKLNLPGTKTSYQVLKIVIGKLVSRDEAIPAGNMQWKGEATVDSVATDAFIRRSFALSLSNISSCSQLKNPMLTERINGLHYAWIQTHSTRMKGL